ncbi:MAG: hypothetical protein WA182_13920 [Candidatus Sulfotelmatobacter sp.]
MKRENRAGNRFDVFQAIANGQDTSYIPSNAEIRKRNLEEFKKDAAAELKAREDAAALAERTAKEKELGITDVMNAVRATEAQKAERIARVYSRDFDILASHAADRGEHAIDPFYQMVVADAPCESSPEDVEKISDAFFAILEDEGVTLSEDDKRRILVYVGLNGIGLADKGVFIDPMAQGTWRGALARLTEMGAIKPKRQSRTEPKPLEITDSSDAAHDRMVVSREVERLVVGSNGWFDNWVASLATGFNFYPTEEQLANAARWLEHRSANLFSADTYNDCRKSLVRQNIWPSHLLTKDEQVEILVEKYNTNDPKQREQFRLEKNRILFGA